MAALPPAAASFKLLPTAGFAVVAMLLAGCTDPASAVASAPEISFKTDDGGGCIDLAPGVTIDQAVEQQDPATSLPIRFDVHFAVDVRGFDKNDVMVQGTAAAGAAVTVTPVKGSRRRYEVRVAKLQPGTISVSVTSAAAMSVGKCTSLTAGSTSTDNTVTYAPPANSR